MNPKEQNRDGSILVAVLIAVTVIAALTAAFYQGSMGRDDSLDVHQMGIKTFLAAETGLNESIHQLNRRTDFVDNDGDGVVDEADEGEPSIGTVLWDPDFDDVGEDGAGGTGDKGEGDGLPTEGEPNVVPIDIGQGIFYTYTVPWDSDGIDNNFDGFVDDAAEEGFYTVHAFGRDGDHATRLITVVIGEEDLSVWNNAVFGGDNGAGASVRGNAMIHGSVHILGKNLTSSDFAIDMSGTSGVRNNYSGIDATIASKIPSLSGDLDAKVRVKKGKVGLSGSATIGEATLEVDGVYVNDGYGGNKGEDNVYSANGVEHKYDVPEGLVEFPSIYDPYTDPATKTPYSSYKDYYSSNSLVVNPTTVPGWNGTIDGTTLSFTATDGTNTITYDASTQTLTVDGMVTIDGDLTVGGTGGGALDLNYTGRGSMMMREDPAGLAGEGTMEVKGDVLPVNTFPTGDVIGFMAEKDINVSASAQLKLAGAFFAQRKVYSAKQNQIAGTFVANEVDMGSNVPSIYQVPSLRENLPPGMIASRSIILHVRVSWREGQK